MTDSKPLGDAAERAIQNQLKALQIANGYFNAHLQDQEAVEFLKARKADSLAIRRFKLGYAPNNWRGLCDHYSKATIAHAAHDAGLLSKQANSNRYLDFFRGRLMFPIHSLDGRIVGYGGRIVVQEPDPEKKAPKFINTPETALFDKGSMLYGLYEHQNLIRSTREATLVEGYMDVITTSINGHDTTVAPMGTAFTDAQLRLLQMLGVRRLFICLDGDGAGQAAAARTLNVIMQSYDPSMEIRVVTLPDNHDPDSFIREFGGNAFAQQKQAATSLADYIHSLLIKGIPEKPCLEDKALYLHRLETYTEHACGELLEQLIAQASEYSGLPPHVIGDESVQRRRMSAFAHYHPLVGLAARWMMFDDHRLQIAGKFRTIQSQDEGLMELGQMAKEILANETPTTTLNNFALAHGELNAHEFAELQRHWATWYKPKVMNHHLDNIRNNPNDEVSRRALRSMVLG
ncbi:toprim domain-containing protein [Pseudomonas aeruginosa]|nr:toprim domain-containing protein [Pseudomonas aeruginosa]ELD5772937.1 toprim domain-containing protein [Pseudomonas aeruginosa]ERW61240.1 DNA primase [Pseudomonas aeruginosa BWHPSA011]ETV28713.1 DNA primase [Pseudomonas aeruginosa BWHPSA041]ETV56020.1 DNA primase [Pseudomonas aeruginosa BWHPSA037]MBA5210272.1 toprim domain-containing protein [Pseudomonas aeruginosa]